MRKRSKDKHLPPCLHYRHGRYYYVKRGVWRPLSRDLASAMAEYGRIVAKPNGGMDRLIDDALADMRGRLAVNTVKQYEQVAERLKTIMAEFAPSQVQPKHVAQIKRAHAATPAMANRMLSFLRSVFHYALEEQLVDSNPAVGIQRFVEKARDRLVSDGEFIAVRKAATPVYAAIMGIAYLTAQRIGDVLAIRLADISDSGIRFAQQKTGHVMCVEMTPELEEAIAMAKAVRGKVSGMTLFHTRKGTPFAYRTVKDMHDRACTKAGVENFHIHDIRAKALTDAKAQGLDPTLLAGHEDERTTAIYLRAKETPVAKPPSFGHLMDK